MQMTILWRALPGAPEREARDAFVRRALGQARFLRLAREPGGKPFLLPAADDPRPPHLSLTHTRGLIACALFDAPVGVDAEPADRQVAAALARRILSEPERARYAALPAAARGAFLLGRWVAREAHGKRTGEGIAGGGAHLVVTDDGRVLDAGGAVLSRVRTLSLAGCLVAVAGPDAPFTLLTEQI